jgi:peptide deformylase
MSHHKLMTITFDCLRDETAFLRATSRPVCDFGVVPDLVDSMRAILNAISYAAGVSAVQLGVPLRLAIVNIPRHTDTEVVLINPRLVRAYGRRVTRREGCLSLPDYAAPVRRRNSVVIEAFDLSGSPYTYEASGYEAAVIQHELDHFDGRCYWDRLEPGIVPAPLREGDDEP